MNLSQERASNVLTYCYDLNNSIITSNLTWLQNNLRANGMSFSKLLYKQGTKIEDKERSRRVEFKVLTTDKLNDY
jgi:outer membrane protein OmpA-like peptidoglycan-associated protein